MRKLLIFGSIALLFVWWLSSSYNRLVSKNEEANAAWQNVESDYQRRLDLIPNLVSTVKGYADFEKSTLEAVVQARAQATQVKFDATNLNKENLQKFQEAQGAVSSSLSRLLVTVEQYPNLKANQNFLELQAELTGTENRIKVSRNNFNEAVKNYNLSVKSFPTNIMASMFGFQARAYFESDAGAEKAPKVEF
ncbi:MAG: LemA family protein [Bacteroidota bacterium]|jgi:LemA protein